MNAATLKSLLFLVSLGLFGGLVYYAYEHRQSQAAPYAYWNKDLAKAVLDNVTRPEAPKPRIVDYKQVVTPALVDLDWTGAPPQKVAEAAPEATGPVEKPKVVVADLLAILMTRVDSQNPGGSSAIVLWKAADLKANPKLDNELRIGRVLPAPYDSAVVKDILVDGIEFAFTRDGQENEVVRVPRSSDGLIVEVDDISNIARPVKRSFISPQVAKVDDRPERTVRLAADIYQIGPLDMAEFGRDYPRILSEDVRLETHFKDGKRAGLKITDVKAGSLAAQHGAVAGDVIISINGEPVQSEQQAIAYVKRNAETTSVWQVVVENLGRQRTVTYNSPQD